MADRSTPPSETAPSTEDPLLRAAVDTEQHVARLGWDQPPRLFALVRTSVLREREPALAAQLQEGDDDGFTAVEQEGLPPTSDLESLLGRIAWPDEVDGVALAIERIVVPPEAEQDLPQDSAAATEHLAAHPDREDVRALAEPLEVPWLRERDRVRALSVSPDGTRVAMVLGDMSRERRRLVVAGIRRDQDGEARGLAPAVAVAGSLVDVSSARWASPSELYLVGQRQEDAAPRGFSLSLGQFLRALPTGDGIDFVEVLPVPRVEGPRPVVRGADGRFHQAEGNQGWSHARNGDELVIPGG